MGQELGGGPGFDHPAALAWITDMTPTMGHTLDFILVPDQCRRRGYATRLIAVCEQMWPDLELSEAISPEGEALLASLPTGDDR